MKIICVQYHVIDPDILHASMAPYSNPPQLTPDGDAVRLARAANDRLAQTIAAYPQRFGGFCALPWQHPQEAADELDRAINELGFLGTLLIGSPGDTFLDDPRYHPVLAKLDELQASIYVMAPAAEA